MHDKETVENEQKISDKEQPQEKRKQIDFKMVTFTLAGKDYGIDIMKVKEISKIGKFTFVPNTAPYVRGVYNLRGDIISVIDLRAFFNLEYENVDQYSKQVNMLILRLEERVLAVIVDAIDKVVGISKESIQPPHPLFGDINIKYISGIVENNNHLYILLDVEKIFSTETLDSALKKTSELSMKVSADIDKNEVKKPVVKIKDNSGNKDDINYKFIEETLVTFKKFYPTAVNRAWIKKRFDDWKKNRKENEIQLQNESDAADFLNQFYSPYSGQLWGDDYLEKIEAVLPVEKEGVLNIWNPGCGAGYETYSIACLLKKINPKALIKIRGNDNDLINISTAPGISDFYKDYIAEGAKGYQFSKEIKDMVIFEYHDVGHNNTLPVLDLVIARDILSFMEPEQQENFFNILNENLKPDGILILGKNEQVLDPKLWNIVEKNSFIAYKKK